MACFVFVFLVATILIISIGGTGSSFLRRRENKIMSGYGSCRTDYGSHRAGYGSWMTRTDLNKRVDFDTGRAIRDCFCVKQGTFMVREFTGANPFINKFLFPRARRTTRMLGGDLSESRGAETPVFEGSNAALQIPESVKSLPFRSRPRDSVRDVRFLSRRCCRFVEFFYQQIDGVGGTEGVDAVADIENRGTGWRHLRLLSGSADADDHQPLTAEIRFAQFLTAVRIVFFDLEIGDLKTADLLAGDFDKIFHGRMNHKPGDLDRATAKRADNAVGAGVFDFVAGFIITGSRDNLKLRVQHARRQNNVDVVRIAGQSGSQRLGAIDAGTFQNEIVGGIAVNVQPAARLTHRLQVFFIAVDHHKGFPPFMEVLTNCSSHTTDATHNVMAV